ncbi:MFS transporter-like protein Fmp42 [Calycina marina]|uniref:MFS transporter-like protein Fmp42 n=1 Tax=Calycina marina TaxID=1763456 RepID=A0A9P7Z5X0_9HELO|nr:MFS transporter-like protein Fmp42 [Calycina marina]
MSLTRVSSASYLSPDRERSPSPSGSPTPRLRKLSFNPLPGDWNAPEEAAQETHAQPIGAFEVSKARRILQIFIAIFYCLLGAGVVFGYAALKPVLIQEHVYRESCTQEELEKGVRTCFEQETRLNLMFTVAAVGTNVAALPIGAILDKFGPRVCSLLGGLFLTAGSLLFAFANQIPFDGYLPGYFFLGLGGPFIYISSFQLSHAFPQHSGLILALLTGAFDSSSAIFLLYRIIYEGGHEAFKLKYFFLIYLAVPCFIFIVQFLCMPYRSYKTIGELVEQVEEEEDETFDDQVNEQTALLQEERRQHRQSVVSEITDLIGSKSGIKHFQEEEQKNKISGVWGAMHGKTVAQQIFSPWCILITLFTVVQMLRINYFVATIRPQYEYLLGSYGKAVEVNTFFDIALPVGGILSIPFIGLVLDNRSTFFVLSCLVTIATTIGVLGCLPYEWAAYANISLFVLYRPFYYTAVSDYSSKIFGTRTFGTVYGMIICLAGLFNLMQSVLDLLLHKVFHGDPVPVNLILLGTAFVVGVALCAYVGTKAYTFERDGLEEEAERANEVAMPSVTFPEDD